MGSSLITTLLYKSYMKQEKCGCPRARRLCALKDLFFWENCKSSLINVNTLMFLTERQTGLQSTLCTWDYLYIKLLFLEAFPVITAQGNADIYFWQQRAASDQLTISVLEVKSSCTTLSVGCFGGDRGQLQCAQQSLFLTLLQSFSPACLFAFSLMPIQTLIHY